MKVYYPKLYNMAYPSRIECFTASKGSNNYFYLLLLLASNVLLLPKDLFFF